MAAIDSVFAGSIPGLYDRLPGPLLFAPYPRIVASRARQWNPTNILETAAGTGIVTEALHQAIPTATIIATDLNPAMLQVAEARIRSSNVTFRDADALNLPFDDRTFDLVVCQFGSMFFPDKVRGHAEARRVLRDGGRYLAVVWDRLASNPASEIAHRTVASLYEKDPPSFLARTPFGYSDAARIELDLKAAGFDHIRIETIAAKSDPTNVRDAAMGLVAGCPLRSEIEIRDPHGLGVAVQATEEALATLDSGAGFQSLLSAHLIIARR
jgi:ubiquinone/menaquinone biosynthesis C-methylase UbiE